MDTDVKHHDLIASVGRFVALDRNLSKTNAIAHNQVLAAMADLNGSILLAEAEGLSREAIESIVAPARKLQATSTFVRRLQTWPRGYPGDFETVEYICDGTNLSPPNTLAFHVENISLNTSLAQQHRNKVAVQGRAIADACTRCDSGAVLSLASGSNRDMRSVASLIKGSNCHFYLNDHDNDALEFSRKGLGPLAKQCEFIEGNAVRVIAQIDRKFDLIVIGGLFDYLKDNFTAYILQNAWARLTPGGTLLVTNIRKDNPYRVWMDYIVDWKLIERDEDDYGQLCRDVIGNANVMSAENDTTGLAIIVTLSKSLRRDGMPVHV